MVEAAVSDAIDAESGTHSLPAYLREIGRTRIPTREQEQALLARMIRGERSARDELITAYLKIVVLACKGYRERGLPLGDLIAEGNLGLIRAARAFEFAQGRFAPFAEWWIHQSIRRALEEHSRSERAGFLSGLAPR